MAMWHLAEKADWEAARATGRYERSTRGASVVDVGFVHCSYPEQLGDVVAAVYADVVDDFVVLELDREALETGGTPVRDEPGDPSDPSSPLYPHVYGPIPVSAVAQVLPAHVDRGRLTVGEPI
ncbi:DUF952 domain-containing protein [Georgenia alba]|uniref:DUF952 domain-containing protein n=1 Tax=Georgenia alba TaxID=2233858 RepID=A0ABW2Q800_9MICO